MQKKHRVNNLITIRKKIDDIDKKIIALLSERFMQAQKAAFVKKESKNIIDKKRNRQIIRTRSSWAKKENLPAAMIAGIFKKIMDFSIQRQVKILNNSNKKP